MNMTLSGEGWKVEQEKDGRIFIEAVNFFTPAEARELAIALDKVIEHVEGRSDV